MNNWQKLCRNIKPLITTSVKEDALQQSLELWLQDIFNWDEASVKHQVPVRVGIETKFADIVLYGGDFGIVIEMKAPYVAIGDDEAGQLISYMRFLNCKYGLLVGNKLKMFYDDGEAVNPVKEAVDIGFEPDNADGVELGEILDKPACFNEKLKEYAVERIKRGQVAKSLEILKAELLSNNGEKIKIIVKEKVLSEGYRGQDIDGILDDLLITEKPGSIYRPKEPCDEIWNRIKDLRTEKHSSWVQLREGCNAIITGSNDYRPGAKSFANSAIHETGLTAKDIIGMLDARSL